MPSQITILNALIQNTKPVEWSEFLNQLPEQINALNAWYEALDMEKLGLLTIVNKEVKVVGYSSPLTVAMIEITQKGKDKHANNGE